MQRLPSAKLTFIVLAAFFSVVLAIGIDGVLWHVGLPTPGAYVWIVLHPGLEHAPLATMVATIFAIDSGCWFIVFCVAGFMIARTGRRKSGDRIGTPHLGSPLAIALLDNANGCVQNVLATFGNKSLRSVLTTDQGFISGAVADLQGDGFGGSLSPALQAFYGVPLPFPMARLSGTENMTNLNGLSSGIAANVLRTVCGGIFGDPLAVYLTPTLWSQVFGQSNDAVVPLQSQLNGATSNPLTVDGVIHSAGLELLDFNPPRELDSLSNIPPIVINLLNEPRTGPDYQ